MRYIGLIRSERNDGLQVVCRLMGVIRRPRRHDCPFAAVFLVPIMIVLQGRRKTPCPSANQFYNVTKVQRSTFMGRAHDIAMPANDEAHSGHSLEGCRYGWLGPDAREDPIFAIIPSRSMVSSTRPCCQIQLLQFADGKPRATWQTLARPVLK
jgi:hypothetical protein